MPLQADTLQDDVIRSRRGETLTTSLLDVTGRAIVRGDYVARDFPTEGELTRLHGVSRSVVREAMKMLTAKGLLAVRPRQGTYVLPEEDWRCLDPDVLRWLGEERPTADLLLRLTEIRLAGEPCAAALAARCAGDQVRLAVLAAAHAAEAARSQTVDPVPAMIEFHGRLLAASGNPLFAGFGRLAATALRLADRLRRLSDSAAAMMVVSEAVMARNAHAAEAATIALILSES